MNRKAGAEVYGPDTGLPHHFSSEDPSHRSLYPKTCITSTNREKIYIKSDRQTARNKALISKAETSLGRRLTGQKGDQTLREKQNKNRCAGHVLVQVFPKQSSKRSEETLLTRL